jgi:hypothetical protein
MGRSKKYLPVGKDNKNNRIFAFLKQKLVAS